MSAYVKQNGVFNQISKMYVKKLGSWCSIKRGWVKKNNVWQLMFSKLLNAKWAQMGTDINGEATSGGFSGTSGRSVSLNAEGNIVAIGARYNDGISGTDSGHVRIYSWNGTIWTQLGSDIDGKAADEQSGQFISLNAAGDRVAITTTSKIRVYSWNGSVWTQLGTDIVGYTKSVSLNATGNIMAIGEPSEGLNTIGRVRIFSWNGSDWIQLGANIDGTGTANSGWCVSLNASGNRVAIGAPLGGPANAGVVRIYYLNGSTWTQLGTDINGYPGGSLFGTSLCMNASGDRLVVGAPASVLSTKIYSWNGTTWTQLGAVIYAEMSGSQNGMSVSMNASGDRIAIGVPANDGNGTDSGHVRIYSWNGTVWTQLASDIDGESASDQSGTSVSMNAVGDRIAIGAPYNNSGVGHVRIYSQQIVEQLGATITGTNEKFGGSVSSNAAGDMIAIGAPCSSDPSKSGLVRIYYWNGTGWTQLGVDINGKILGEQFGYSVSLNAIGNILVVGAPINNVNGFQSGKARIYFWNGTAWTQLGVDLDGTTLEGLSGWSVSINATGDRVAIGSPYINQVKIYSWNGTAWTQLGTNITSSVPYGWAGRSVSLNATGDRVAIGAPSAYADSGFVRIYSWNGFAWVQLGADINGTLSESAGYSVSLNAAGNTVAIGAYSNSGNGIQQSGCVKIYSWNETTWTQLGGNINGEGAFDQSGSSISLNAAGDRVAIGSSTNDGNGLNSGHVRIHYWNGTAWTQVGPDIDGESAHEGSGASVSMNASGDRVAIGSPPNDHTRIYLLS